MTTQPKDIPFASMDAVKAGDRAAWLALFTDDAVVQDPVGPSDWEPTGKGLVGKEAIGGFYDMFATFQEDFDYEVHHLATGNSEVVAYVTMHSTMKDGTTMATNAINLYDVTEDGHIRSLRSFQKVP
jgi:ketosteroid isomerase-like protein